MYAMELILFCKPHWAQSNKLSDKGANEEFITLTHLDEPMSEIIKPYSDISRDRLTKLINDSNPNQQPLVEWIDFQFGKPLSTTKTGFNTRVRLKNLNPDKASDRDVFYNRLGLDVLGELPEGFIKEVDTGTYEFSIHGAIDAINSALGLDLTIEEVVDRSFVLPQDKYPLTIGNNGSFAWLGDTTYYFTIKDQSVWLASIWTNVYLDGLYPPKPAE